MALRNGELFLSYGVMGGFMQACLLFRPLFLSMPLTFIIYPSLPSPKAMYRSC